jgi:urea transport system permease protein
MSSTFKPTGRLYTSIFNCLIGLGFLLGCAHFLPESSPLHVSEFTLSLIGKYICYAIVALAIDLCWGFTGILSLGQGAFFALGAYAMGMHLMRSMSGQGVYASALPDFMVFLDWKELPWYWQGFDQAWLAFLMILLIPGLLAFIIGYLAFRSRVKGVYFSIISQALTYLLMTLFFQNELGFGGNNGLTDFKTLLGFSLQDPATKRTLYFISLLALLGTWLLVRSLVQRRLGLILVAIRDGEQRLRFCGYPVAVYKTFVFVLAAMICGLAGALYVPQVGIINPSEMAPAQSIEMVIWVAFGGRGTLLGAVLGALILSALKSWLTDLFPELWLFILGTLFIAVTLYLPRGILSLIPDPQRWNNVMAGFRRRSPVEGQHAG